MRKLYDLINKKPIVAFWLVIIFQIVVIVILGCLKSNFHQDELYSFETAHYLADSTPHNSYMHETEIFQENTWLYVSDFKPFLVVDDESSLLSDEPERIVYKLVFDRLYMCLINIVETLFFKGVVSKWVGIIINIPFIVIGQYILFRLTSLLTNSSRWGLLSTIFYGFSAISLGFSIYTRFYCLVLTMILLAVYLHYLMWNEQGIFKIVVYELIAYFCLFKAMISSELVAVIIIAIYMSYTLSAIFKKKWRQALINTVPLFIGFVFFLPSYISYFINVVTYPERYVKPGSPFDLMYTNLVGLGARQLIRRIYYFFVYLGDYQFGSVVLFTLIVILIVVFKINQYKKTKENVVENDFIYVIYGTVIIYSIFSILVALWLPRYYSLIYPLIVIIMIYVISTIKISSRKIALYILGIGTVACIALGACLGHIDNIFISDRESILKLENKGNMDCVVWNMDDFQIIMECVYQMPDNTRFYVSSEYDELIFDDFDDEFLLWVSRGEKLTPEKEEYFINNGYMVEEDLGIVADANIYCCVRMD